MNLANALQNRRYAEEQLVAAKTEAVGSQVEFDERAKNILLASNLVEALTQCLGGAITPLCTTKELTDDTWYLDMLFLLDNAFIFYYTVNYDLMGYDWIRISLPRIYTGKDEEIHVDFDGITLRFEEYAGPKGSKVPYAFHNPIRQEEIVEAIARRKYFTLHMANDEYEGQKVLEIAINAFCRHRPKAILFNPGE